MEKTIDGVSISHRMVGIVNTPYTFRTVVSLVTAAQPVTYAWQASGLGMVAHTGGDLDDTATFT
jgi:hypothetical protein